MRIDTGITGTAALVVGREDTAIALGSGDVPVLGTPRVAALMEQAAVAALVGRLDPDSTTVGTRISVDHLAPSFVGAEVEASAEVVDVDGRSIVFRLSVHEDERLVAAGEHARFVVDRSGFIGR